MKKNSAKVSQRGIKRAAKNKARMKKNQEQYDSLLYFLENKVLPKYSNLWTKEQSDKARKENQ